MQTTTLGQSGLQVTPICLGTMTFGEQVDDRPCAPPSSTALSSAGHQLHRHRRDVRGAARRQTYGATETIIGRWLASRPGMRQRVVLASKVAGPARGMDWVRGGAADLTRPPTSCRPATTACAGCRPM
jgi:aryl-alcohol dehydrogenase-like predicted oxidoreductase